MTERREPGVTSSCTTRGRWTTGAGASGVRSSGRRTPTTRTGTTVGCGARPSSGTGDVRLTAHSWTRPHRWRGNGGHRKTTVSSQDSGTHRTPLRRPVWRVVPVSGDSSGYPVGGRENDIRSYYFLSLCGSGSSSLRRWWTAQTVWEKVKFPTP